MYSGKTSHHEYSSGLCRSRERTLHTMYFVKITLPNLFLVLLRYGRTVALFGNYKQREFKYTIGT